LASDVAQLGYISCQLLLQGGSMVPRYVFLFYFVKNHEIATISTAVDAIKNNTELESIEFYNF
jgi:hypothetical protein